MRPKGWKLDPHWVALDDAKKDDKARRNFEAKVLRGDIPMVVIGPDGRQLGAASDDPTRH